MQRREIIYKNNTARYNDLQGTCLPLITPGTEFWTADGKNDCKALSITENVLFETGVGTEREEFAKDDVKDMKRDKVLYERLWKKIDEVMKNPEHYPVKSYGLKGKRAAHIGSYVIVFQIVGNDVVFLRFSHHDYAYE